MNSRELEREIDGFRSFLVHLGVSEPGFWPFWAYLEDSGHFFGVLGLDWAIFGQFWASVHEYFHRRTHIPRLDLGHFGLIWMILGLGLGIFWGVWSWIWSYLAYRFEPNLCSFGGPGSGFWQFLAYFKPILAHFGALRLDLGHFEGSWERTRTISGGPGPVLSLYRHIFGDLGLNQGHFKGS